MFYKKFNIFLIFFSFSLTCFSQTTHLKGTVFSKDKKLPLPFVNIGVMDKNTATIGDEKGYFEIETLPTDTLVFSMVGYHTLKVVARQCGNEVLMEAQNFQLPELTVKPVKMVTKRVGFAKPEGNGAYHGYERLAVFIENQTKTEGIIQKVHYIFRRDTTSIKWKTCSIRVRIYKRDPATQLPAEDMLAEPVIVEIQEKNIIPNFRKRIAVDLSNYAIPFPEEGVFVGLDILGFTDHQGNFIKYTAARDDLSVISTGESEAKITCHHVRGRWFPKRQNYSRSLNNACFSLDVKFPAQ